MYSVSSTINEAYLLNKNNTNKLHSANCAIIYLTCDLACPISRQNALMQGRKYFLNRCYQA